MDSGSPRARRPGKTVAWIEPLRSIRTLAPGFRKSEIRLQARRSRRRSQLQAGAPAHIQRCGRLVLGAARAGHNKAGSVVEPQEQAMKRPLPDVFPGAVFAVDVAADDHAGRSPPGEQFSDARRVNIVFE